MAQRMVERVSQIEGSSVEDVAFWICLFALDQHKLAEELGCSPERGPFFAALAKASNGVVMVLDSQIHPFRRIWCLFEVSCIHKAKGKSFCLTTDEGPLGGVGQIALKRSTSGNSEQLPANMQEVATALQIVMPIQDAPCLAEPKRAVPSQNVPCCTEPKRATSKRAMPCRAKTCRVVSCKKVPCCAMR